MPRPIPEEEREPLGGHATDLQWMMAQDGLKLGVNEDHPDSAKHYITMEPGAIPLIRVDEERVKRLCSGLYELEAYTLRYILTHAGCTLGEVLFSRRGKDLPATSPKQMLDAAEKLLAEGRIHLTRRWVADAISPREKQEREEMESLESQEWLRKNPEARKRIQAHNPDLIKEVQVPHEPTAEERKQP